MTLRPDTVPTVNTADNKWWQKRLVNYMREFDSHQSTDTKTQEDIKTEYVTFFYIHGSVHRNINPYPTAFPYGNGMVLHFYQQQESSTTKTVHKVINKGLKTYV